MMRTPENVKLREEATARCTAKIKRRVLRRLVRKARAEHLVRCSLVPVKKKAKRKPLTELPKTDQNGKRSFKDTVKRCTPTWKKPKKNRKTESNLWKKGNQQFTEDGRNAEITVDLVLQARAKPSENKVNGIEDAIVSEMIKRLPMEKILHYHEMFPGTFHGKGIRSYRAIALTSGDVEAVRIMHPAAFGERKGARKMEEATYWWIWMG